MGPKACSPSVGSTESTGTGRNNGPCGKEVVVVKITVYPTGNLGSFRTECGTPALEKHHNHDPAVAGIGIAAKPTKSGAGMRAGSGLAQYLFFIEIYPQAARRAVVDGAGHAVGDFRHQAGNVQMTLDHGLEVRDVKGVHRML